jgi:hypothetical protein
MATQADRRDPGISELLKNLGGTLRGGILRIPSEDGSQRVEWQAVEGDFSYDSVTIRRRAVGSYWEDVSVGHVLEELRKAGAVALWLQRYTRANVSFESLSLREPNEPAYLKALPDDSDADSFIFRSIESRTEGILEAKHELIHSIDYSHAELIDAVVAAYGDRNEKLSGSDLIESAAQQAVEAICRRIEGAK